MINSWRDQGYQGIAINNEGNLPKAYTQKSNYFEKSST